MASNKSSALKIGDLIEVSIEKVAHGGHFIARHEGAVIFVRHAIPGELCTIEITSTGSSFNRADVVSVSQPSEFRVVAPCQFSHRNGCGGCDFQHITPAYQRKLKSDVIAEQFSRIAKMDVQVEVEEVGAPTGWRTRAIATTNRYGKLGFFKSRSHSIAPVDNCIICVDEMRFSEIATRPLKGDVRVEISASNTGERTIALAPTRGEEKARITEGPAVLRENVRGRTLEVSQESFWQSHKDAPELLTKAVLDFAQLQSGEHVLDLYGGVGLFTAAIIDQVGATGQVDLIEGSKIATEDARRNFAQNKNITVATGDVARLLPRISSADVVVLDPPREGAGKDVIAQLSALNPRAIIYVACDPAALARDTVYLQDHSYSLAGLRAFDLFPMTHHIECVALYERAEVS
ncbi:MAG: class I SAM-dependent RNA methyltransferase [Candidatus Planktophila sp.]|nr:class I SAM-dependent RNA methyltransferase [Candidatus Planktophila sp.]